MTDPDDEDESCSQWLIGPTSASLGHDDGDGDDECSETLAYDDIDENNLDLDDIANDNDVITENPLVDDEEYIGSDGIIVFGAVEFGDETTSNSTISA